MQFQIAKWIQKVLVLLSYEYLNGSLANTSYLDEHT